MARIVFLDFVAFADALGGMVGEFLPTARSTEAWWVQSVATGRVLTQILQVGGRTTFAGDSRLDRVAIYIPLTDPRKIRVDGRFLEQHSYLLIGEAQPFTLTTSEETRWAGVVVPSNHELLGAEFVKPHVSRLFDNRATVRTDTNAEHLDRIRSLLVRVSAAVDNILFNTAAVRRAEEEIMATVSRVLETSSHPRPRQLGRPAFSRTRVVGRILSMIEASNNTPLVIADLCRATGVSERTLRSIFHEYFGVGPMRLLKVHQLGQIRSALLAADPAHEMVTSIAARFGIWDFSLFARNYKALFGESPSHTLRAASKRAQRQFIPRDMWLQYAACAFARKDAASLPGQRGRTKPKSRGMSRPAF